MGTQWKLTEPIFLGSKITTDGDCSHEIKRHLLLGRKAGAYLDAATTAKSLQSCPTLWDPIDGSPPGSSLPGILQARALQWVAISFSNARKWKLKVKSLSCVQLFVTPWTVAYQAPPSMEFSRQQYWSARTNLDNTLKSRDITLLTKVHIVKAMVFPVVMFGCESWMIKKAEHQRIDAFERWHWRRLLRVPQTARRSNLSILKEISPEYSLEGLMLRLKLQYFGHLMWRTDSLEKTLMLGKTEGRRRRGWQRMRWLDGITDSVDHEFEQAQGVGNGQGSLVCCSPWDRKELDATEQLNWIELNFSRAETQCTRSGPEGRVEIAIIFKLTVMCCLQNK